MDDSSLTAVMGIAGLIATLCGVVVTGWFGLHADNRRRKHENETRWHDNRLSLSSRMVDVARKIEEGVLDAAVFTDNEDRAERLPGRKSVLSGPRSGIPGVIDDVAIEIVSEAVEAAFEALAELGRLESELQLMGEAEEQAAADELYDAALAAIGVLDQFEMATDVYRAAYELRAVRSAFVQTTRSALGITRPRRSAAASDGKRRQRSRQEN